MRKLSIGLSAIALMAVSVAHAQSPATPPAPPMKDMTRAEAKAHAEKMFDAMDANHDGKLDKADGEARRAKHFDMMDTNHDGQLSRQEFEAAHEKMRGPGKGMDMPPSGGPMAGGPMAGGPDDKGRRGPGMKMGMRMGMRMGMMEQADPNHTGTVTKDAFVGAALKMFDSADANHDGKVTPEERRAAMKAHMGDRGPRWGGNGPRGGHHQGPGPDGHGGHDMPPPPPGE